MQHVQRHWSYKKFRREKQKETMKYNFSDLTNRQLSEMIDDWIRDERNRNILKDRFIRCMTFEEISCKYNICERHVKRIVYKYGDFLLSKIK